MLLIKLSGREALSELYQFDLELLAPQPLAFDQLLGQRVLVTLHVPGSAVRRIGGIINELGQGEEVSESPQRTLLRYSATQSYVRSAAASPSPTLGRRRRPRSDGK